MENKVKFGEAIRLFWINIFNYKEKTGINEYWYVVLLQDIVALVGFLVYFIGNVLYDNGTIENLAAVRFITGVICVYMLVSLVPWISLNVRRLRDAGKSGWWTLLMGIIGIGLAVLLLLCSTRTKNSFSPDNNTAVCVYGPPEYFEEEIEVNPGISEPIDIPIEVYGPPEFFEEEENDDDQ